jgi:hypothetical protein
MFEVWYRRGHVVFVGDPYEACSRAAILLGWVSHKGVVIWSAEYGE